MKNKKIALLIVIALSVLTLVACTKDSKENENSVSEIEQNQQVENSLDEANNTDKTDSTNNTKENENSASKTEQNQQVKDNLDKADNTDKPNSTNNTKGNENIREDNTTNTVTKIEGRRKEFLERLDNIQKELDALPEKKDSDAGVTNAMKNYYGRSYEMYDNALNEIYALLKKELSPETMEDLKTKQIKWIEEKEEKANKAAEKYKGGTFEFVSRYISLYDSTKEKCYELVNEYMTD